MSVESQKSEVVKPIEFDLGDKATQEQKTRVYLERIDRLAPHWFKVLALILGGAVSWVLCQQLFDYLERVMQAYQAHLVAAALQKTAHVGFDWHMLLMGWVIVLALTVVVVATMRVISPVEQEAKDTDIPSVAALKEVLELAKSIKDVAKD